MNDRDQADNDINIPKSAVDAVVLLLICLSGAMGARGRGETQAQLMMMMTRGGGGGGGREEEGRGGGQG